jgi:hypothetical protein
MSSSDAFAKTYLGLLAILWAELEALLDAIDSLDPSINASANHWPVQAQAEAVLLETELLRECCDKDSVVAALTCEQRRCFRVLLHEIHDLLDLEPMQLPNSAARSAIMRAQDRVFDEAYGLAVDSCDADAAFVSDEEVEAVLEYRYTPNSRSDFAVTHGLQQFALVGNRLA